MNARKSLKAAKRVSTRYTVTREDCQLDPRSGRLPEKIKVTPIPCGSSGKRKFRLAIVDSTDKICNLRALEEDLQLAGLNLHVSAVETTLNTLLDVIPRYMARTGRSVRLGNLITLKPYVTGSINNANDELDSKKNHLEIHATISPALRHSLAKAQLVNVKHRRIVIENVIREMNGARSDDVDAKHTLLINGKGIYVPPQSATDVNTHGRVWIETLDGKMLGRCAVLNSGPDLVSAKFVPNARVSAGEVRLIVETYGSKEAADAGNKASLSRYSRVVRIVEPCDAAS